MFVEVHVQDVDCVYKEEEKGLIARVRVGVGVGVRTKSIYDTKENRLKQGASKKEKIKR